MINEKYKVTSFNWDWSWKHAENYAAMELIGIYKEKNSINIRTLITYRCLAQDETKSWKIINETVNMAEAHVIIMETPLFKVMNEK